MVDQRQSTRDASVAQLELLPVKKVCPPVDKPYLFSLPTLRRVIRYSVSLADLEPCDVYRPLGIDKAVWSRIENGGMSFPGDELLLFQSIVRNKAALMWLAHQSGDELTPLRSDLERRNAELEEELAQERRDKQVMIELWRQVQR